MAMAVLARIAQDPLPAEATWTASLLSSRKMDAHRNHLVHLVAL